jgi:surface carbohydrate biosynthesis protein (TIGR04326 family)
MEGLLYLWDGYAEEHGTRSLFRHLEANADRLRQRYLSWIHDFGESRVKGRRIVDHLVWGDGLSYWWLTLLVEKSPYKSRLNDYMRILAIEDVVHAEHPTRVRLVSANPDLHEAISGLCNRNGIPYEWQSVRVRRNPFYRLGRRFVEVLRLLRTLILYIVRRWSLRENANRKWSGQGSVFLCSYFDGNVDADAAERGEFRSHYWGELHGLLNRLGLRTNWLHIFVPGERDAHIQKGWIRNYNLSASAAHAFVDSYLSWGILARVIKNWVWLISVRWRLRELKHAAPTGCDPLLWPVLSGDWMSSLGGPTSVSVLFSIELFDAALREIPHQHLGFYLCENQAWERSLIHAWKKHGHGRLIGVPHSTVRFWDLRYFVDRRTIFSESECPIPQPDCVALNGPVAVSALLEAGYPKDRIRECEALRYSYLNRRLPRKHGRLGNHLRVIVLGDIMADATGRLLKLLQRYAVNGPDTIEYVLKGHPNCPVDPNQFPKLKMTVAAGSLESALQTCDVAYGSNGTSAVMDAYLFGARVVVMLDDTDLNMSPLRGQRGVSFVSTPSELGNALAAASESSAQYAKANECFFLDSEYPRWLRLLVS